MERFSADIDERVRGRLQLIADLREAITGDGLHLAYQPIVDLQSGRIAGYEALVRWNHPTRGPLSPAQFIPVAEESGLIVELGGWVLRRATAQLASWQREWQDDRYVSVNVAAAQFATGALGAQLEGALRASGLHRPSCCWRSRSRRSWRTWRPTWRSSRPSATWACAWRSTTSAPATRR